MTQNVLIIDDDTYFTGILSQILKKSNHTVFVANTIEEGITLLKDRLPELVYLDNQLPDGYGWGKAEYIMANFPNIQLNLISALDVPKTTTSLFRIVEKQQLLEELTNNE